MTFVTGERAFAIVHLSTIENHHEDERRWRSELAPGIRAQCRRPVSVINIEVNLSEIEFEPSMDKIRVLIIDEHGAVRRALAARLDSYSQVEVAATASSFSEGLKKACMLQPDVILFELKSRGGRRPEQVGEMIDSLTDHPAGIIVLTAYADDDERKAALEAGARRYLVKHIDSGLLVAEIQAVASEVANQVG